MIKAIIFDIDDTRINFMRVKSLKPTDAGKIARL